MTATGMTETKEGKYSDSSKEEALEVLLAPAERAIDASEDLTEIMSNFAPQDADEEDIEDYAEEIVEGHLEAAEEHFE